MRMRRAATLIESRGKADSLLGLAKQNAHSTRLSFQSQLQTHRLSNLRNVRTTRLLRSLKRNAPPALGPLRRRQREMFLRTPRKHGSDTRNPQLRSLLNSPLKMIELEHRQQQVQGKRSISLQLLMQSERHFLVRYGDDLGPMQKTIRNNVVDLPRFSRAAHAQDAPPGPRSARQYCRVHVSAIKRRRIVSESSDAKDYVYHAHKTTRGRITARHPPPAHPAENQSSHSPPAAPLSPAAYAPPHYSDTTAESPANPPPESAAPPHNPSAAPLRPSPQPPPPAEHPPAHSHTAPDSHPSAESSPTHTHIEKYPDPHSTQSTAAHTSETPPSSHPHRTSQTPPNVSADRSPPRATAAASPPPSAESSHPSKSSA